MKPSPPWRLPCPWCDFFIFVNARGMRGKDPGSGVEAAKIMETHVDVEHGKTWREFQEFRLHEHHFSLVSGLCVECGEPHPELGPA